MYVFSVRNRTGPPNQKECLSKYPFLLMLCKTMESNICCSRKPAVLTMFGQCPLHCHRPSSSFLHDECPNWRHVRIFELLNIHSNNDIRKAFKCFEHSHNCPAYYAGFTYLVCTLGSPLCKHFAWSVLAKIDITCCGCCLLCSHWTWVRPRVLRNSTKTCEIFGTEFCRIIHVF